MERVYRLTVPAGEAGQRLDRYLSGAIPGTSREKIKRAILEGRCRVRGLPVKEPALRLMPEQEVELFLPAPEAGIVPEQGDIAPIWHDADMLVIDKPAGITVHPCPSCPRGTLAHRLVAHFPQLTRQEGLRPGIVHRLDKDTSGLLAVALTEKARLALSAGFAERKVRKEYLALAHGAPPKEGESREPLGRHPASRIKMAVVPEKLGGKPAHTQWETLWTAPGGKISLLRVRIHTGRTHQIRVHLAQAGFPLWGDATYGGPPSVAAPRQMLHAWKLALAHPVTGQEISFTCPPPKDMLETALALAARMRRIILTGLPGCGKSTLLALLQARGLPVWSADAVVTELYAPGGDGRRFLAGRFGERFVPAPAAPADRAALRQAMLEDPALRREVETAVHAMVRHSLDEFWRRCEAQGRPAAVAEVPLYLEKGWKEPPEDVPLVVGVACPGAARHQRLAESRGWTSEECARMDAWQWPEARKLAACGHVVDNAGPAEVLETQADNLVALLKALRRQEREALARRLTDLWSR